MINYYPTGLVLDQRELSRQASERYALVTAAAERQAQQRASRRDHDTHRGRIVLHHPIWRRRLT